MSSVTLYLPQNHHLSVMYAEEKNGFNNQHFVLAALDKLLGKKPEPLVSVPD